MKALTLTFEVSRPTVSHMKVDVHASDGVGWLVLTRPEVRNALDLDTIDELTAGLDQHRTAGERAIVVAGAGNAFCAGADLALVRTALAGVPAEVLGPLVDNLHEFIRRLRAFPAPVVAAVEGPAVGAGLGLALACDIRIAARSAVFIPGYFGIGASPDAGVSAFLTRSIGTARAESIILRNASISAEQAATWGMVEELVEDGGALHAAGALAGKLTGTPPLALLRTRELVDSATTHSLDEHLDAERKAVASMWPTDDFREGVSAFLERRDPKFTGG
jgi:2-(1,2-epoxy-1,2-dihydrophenyl)acetyl-CoA isomerase